MPSAAAAVASKPLPSVHNTASSASAGFSASVTQGLFDASSTESVVWPARLRSTRIGTCSARLAAAMSRLARRLGQQAPLLPLVGAQHVGFVALRDLGQLVGLNLARQRQEAGDASEMPWFGVPPCAQRSCARSTLHP
jgi:hypothetical protein